MIRTFLTRLHACDVAQSLERRASGHGKGCRSLEGELGGFRDEVAFVGADVLGERAFAPAEQAVTGLKPFHVSADRFDLPGDVGSPDRLLRDAESVPGRADDERRGPHDVPVLRIDRGRVYAHEHVAVADRGTLDLPSAPGRPEGHTCLGQLLSSRSCSVAGTATTG